MTHFITIFEKYGTSYDKHPFDQYDKYSIYEHIYFSVLLSMKYDYDRIEEVQNKYYERLFALNIVEVFDGLALNLKEWNHLARTLSAIEKYQLVEMKRVRV